MIRRYPSFDLGVTSTYDGRRQAEKCESITWWLLVFPHRRIHPILLPVVPEAPYDISAPPDTDRVFRLTPVVRVAPAVTSIYPLT